MLTHRIKMKRTRMVEANSNAHTNLKVGLGKLVYEENQTERTTLNSGKLN
jgi:hypothetical protein